MRPLLIPLVCAAALAAAANPVVRDPYTADPAARVFGDRIYLYTSHDEREATYFDMWDWQLFSTDDLGTWTQHGPVFHVKNFAWAKQYAWAPDALEANGRYYLFLPVDRNKIGVAVADAPTGPFKDAIGAPLIDATTMPEAGVEPIDPALFRDDDGQVYMFFGCRQPMVARLDPSLTRLAGPLQRVALLDPAGHPIPQALPEKQPAIPMGYGEAPFVFKRAGKYYFVYSNGWAKESTLVYATGDSATGPFTYAGEVMRHVPCVTHHGSIVEFRGKWHVFYHTSELSGGNTFRRNVCVDELTFAPDGRIIPVAATPPVKPAVEASPSVPKARIANAAAEERPRVIVLTDIANEPDDEESLVRFLVYVNEFEVEGLIATTSTWLKKGPREDLVRRQLAAYAQVQPNLRKHASGYPTAEELLAVTHTGQTDYGMAAVGPGKQTAGSQRILAVLAEPDPRPIWVTVWGGANTLAQGLLDLRATASPADLQAAIAKLRVYAISDQDDAGAWLRREFPELSYIVSPSQDGHEYWRATWTGISGDRFYKNGPFHKFALVDNPWLEENIIQEHGPLGAHYPRVAYIMEGDTPSYLGLIDNGLGWPVSPAYGGWGGRYALYRAHGEARKIWTNYDNTRDTVTADNGKTETSDMATIWRWREHFQHDFAARMDWCVADSFAQANHNPQPVLNGDKTKNILTIQAKAGDTVTLSADGTTDPDGHAVKVLWWIYHEAGTLKYQPTLTATDGATATVQLPPTAKAATVHVILQAEDDGAPHLFAYRRAVIEVSPSPDP